MKQVEDEAVRTRIYPRLHDATFILTATNLTTFNFLVDIIKKKNIEKTLNILDMGCGFKPFEKYLSEKGIANIKYIGIDFNSDSKADIILDLNKDQIPLNDETIDIVILSEVLEHLYNPIHAISEAIRLLKKGGYIFISTPFVFPYHGTPHDYYRYTEFFYRKIAGQYKMELIKVHKGGTFLSVPVFIMNIFITIICEKLKIPLLAWLSNFFFNLLAIHLDKILLWIGHKLGIEDKLQYMNAGISLIMKK